MTNYENNLINKLNQLITDKYINSESITDDLCHELGISRSNLYRLLKENFQISPSLYIRKIKLNKAKELLSDSDLKISEIAYSIGIDSPQNFTKYFTKQFGINPTESRKQLDKPVEKVDIEIKEKEAGVIEKRYTPIISRKKSKFSENLSYFIPGIIVLLLTTIGFYYWQKSYFNDENELPIIQKNSIAILSFDCFGFEKNSNLCDTLNKNFYNTFLKMENIYVLNSELRDTSNSENNNNKFADKFGVKYFLTGNMAKVGNSIALKIELLNGIEKKVVWTKNYQLDVASNDINLNSISVEISNLLKSKTIITKKEKFYLIPDRNMNTYKQFLQSSQFVFDWNNLNYIQK